MPEAALPLVGAGVSALGGLFGRKKSTTEQNRTETSNSTMSQEASQAQRREFDENPLFAGGREQLMAQLMSEFNKAQAPVMGNAQSTKFMADLNELTNAATDKLKSTLAGSGGLDNGRFAGGAVDLQRNRIKEASNFMSQLPMMNEEIRRKQTNGLMGLASQWLGLGPVNETITGNSSSSATENRTSNMTGSTKGDDGGGGWRGALGGLADFGAGLVGDFANGEGNRWTSGFGGSPSPRGNSYDPKTGAVRIGRK